MNQKDEIPCMECKGGHYEEFFSAYKTKAADETEISIPKVRLIRCVQCGDELIPPETQKQIDRAIAEQTEQLSQSELEEIATKFNLDQTQISEVLGLGSKTFHRWLNGTQYPSRSMGYYLRVLAEYPEAMEWLKERSWRKNNRIKQFANINLATQFSDLAWVTSQAPGALRGWQQQSFPETTSRRFNPVAMFVQTKVT